MTELQPSKELVEKTLSDACIQAIKDLSEKYPNTEFDGIEIELSVRGAMITRAGLVNNDGDSDDWMYFGDDSEVCFIKVKLLTDDFWVFPFPTNSELALSPYDSRLGRMVEAGVCEILEVWDFPSPIEGSKWAKSQGFVADNRNTEPITNFDGWKAG